MNETPTIKLTGRFNKTFSVKKEENGYKGLEYSIEWDFDNKQTRTPLVVTRCNRTIRTVR